MLWFDLLVVGDVLLLILDGKYAPRFIYGYMNFLTSIPTKRGSDHEH